MERRSLVAEAVLAGAELNEVSGGLGDNVVVEVEVDATALLCVGGQLSCLDTGCGARWVDFSKHEMQHDNTAQEECGDCSGRRRR